MPTVCGNHSQVTQAHEAAVIQQAELLHREFNKIASIQLREPTA